jgi:hypothetical protein
MGKAEAAHAQDRGSTRDGRDGQAMRCAGRIRIGQAHDGQGDERESVAGEARVRRLERRGGVWHAPFGRTEPHVETLSINLAVIYSGLG